MSDPVAVLTGKEELEVDDGRRAVPDAAARNPSQEELPHDAGVEEQLAKKQGPWPTANRTQVERDELYNAASGAIDPTRETEDIVLPEEERIDERPVAAGLLEEIESMCDRASQDLDIIAELKGHLDRVVDKARKVAEDECLGPETIQRLQAAAADPEFPRRVTARQVLAKFAAPRRPALLPAQRRAARILAKVADWPVDAPPKGIGLPTEVRPANQAFIDDLQEMTKAADDWRDMGWWYEKEFPLSEDKRTPFKTALFLKMATCGERCHQFTTADTDNGVLIKVDRTEKGFNPQFTKMANEVYQDFGNMKLPVVMRASMKKIAGEIKMLIIRKRMVPQEDHVCPHCEQVIGEKETFWPEEYRDHPDEMITQHSPCGGLYSQPRKDPGDILKMLQPGQWHDHSDDELNKQEQAKNAPPLDLDRMLANLHERRGECPGCSCPYHKCTCSDEERPEWPESAAALIKEMTKTSADKPFRRRVEVIITDGLNVWGQKHPPAKGGVWFPGGGVDARDEKFADAAAREVIEESGFEVDEIYRLARIKPCECVWNDSVIDQAEGKWEEKAKQYKGDRTHLYVATIKSQGAPTSQEGDAMDGEWMKFSDAIRKLRNAIPHDNQGWRPLTRARLRAIEMLAPAGLKVPRRGEVDEVYEEVADGGE